MAREELPKRKTTAKPKSVVVARTEAQKTLIDPPPAPKPPSPVKPAVAPPKPVPPSNVAYAYNPVTKTLERSTPAPNVPPPAPYRRPTVPTPDQVTVSGFMGSGKMPWETPGAPTRTVRPKTGRESGKQAPSGPASKSPVVGAATNLYGAVQPRYGGPAGSQYPPQDAAIADMLAARRQADIARSVDAARTAGRYGPPRPAPLQPSRPVPATVQSQNNGQRLGAVRPSVPTRSGNVPQPVRAPFRPVAGPPAPATATAATATTAAAPSAGNVPYVYTPDDTELRSRAAQGAFTPPLLPAADPPLLPAAAGEIMGVSAPSMVPESPYVPSGMGPEADAILNSDNALEDYRLSRQDNLARDIEATLAQILGGVATPDKGEFVAPWIQEYLNFKALYDGATAERQALFGDEQAKLRSIYDDIQGRQRGAYQSQLADIAQQASAGQQAAGAGVAATRSNLAGVQAGSAADQAALDAARAARASQMGETLGQYGLSDVAAAGSAVLNANRGSALPDDVLSAMLADRQRALSSQAASSQRQATSSYNAALERVLQDMADTVSQSYGRQQNTAIDQLGRYAPSVTALLGGQTGALKDFYAANQGAARTSGDVVGQFDVVRKLLDDMTRDTTLRKAVLDGLTQRRGQDVSAVTQRRGQDISSETQRRGQDVSSETQRRGQDVSATTQMAKIAAQPASQQKPRVISGDEALRYYKVAPSVAAEIRQAVADAKKMTSQEWIYDPNDKKGKKKTRNPYYNPSPEAWKKAVEDFFTSSDGWGRTGADKLPALRAYLYGAEVESPKAEAASAARSGNPVVDAKAVYDQLKRSGVRVDGYNNSSEKHKETNPRSDHDTGKAFDYHISKPNDAEAVAFINKYAPSGLRYIIHNRKIYEAKNGWQPRPFVGYYSNGKPKDPHLTHIHANW